MKQTPTKKENSFVEVSFKDTDLGISKVTMKKIRTPLFTTKRLKAGV
jgi:hypothetical protein